MKITGSKLVALGAAVLVTITNAQGQSTAFSYQGRLTGNGSAANGTYDLRFALFDAAASGSQIGGTQTNSQVVISNGLFSASLDFGSNAFNGLARWIEIGVRTNGGGAFRTLPSRQPVASAPYAMYAARAGGVAWSNVTGLPAGFADGVDNAANYAPGPGIITNGAVISLSFDANGTSTNVSRADHTHLGQLWFNWANLAGIPATFADGVDNDTTYSAGAGLGLIGTQFSIIFGTNGIANAAARTDHDHRGQPWFSWTNLANIPAGFIDGIDDTANYTAGVGLAITGSVISVTFGTNGIATTAARSDHDHRGQPWFSWTNLANIPAEFADGLDNTANYTAGTGLAINGSIISVNFDANGTSTNVSHADHTHTGQLWFNWANLAGIPASFADGVDNDTTYSAGTGLGLAGTQFNISFGTNGVATTAARSDHDHRGQPWFSWTNLANIPAGFIDGTDDTANYTAGVGLAINGSVISVNFDSNGTSTNVSHADHIHTGQPWFNWANLAGIPAGFTDGVDNDTTYSAGTGLALAGTQFNINFGTNGVATTAARSDHDHRGQPWFSWTNLANIPAGFIDGTDDTANYTAGIGLLISGSLISVNFDANGTSTNVSHADHIHTGQPWFNWANLAGIPAGFADGTDNDTTYSAGTGLALAGTQFNINFGTNGVATTAARSDHDHRGQPWFSWTNLANIPAGFLDGVDNTANLTAGAGLNINGSIIAVNFDANGTSTNVSHADHIHTGQPWFNWANLAGIPAGFADGTDNDTTYSAGTGLALAGTQFSINFGTNGVATTAARSDHDHRNQAWFSWTNLANIPAGFADGVDNTANLTAGTGLNINGSIIAVNFDANGTSTNVSRSDHDHRNQAWFSWTNLANIPAGFLDGVDNTSSLVPGFGLSTNGSILNVVFGGDGNSNSVARSDHDHHGETWIGNNYDGIIVQSTATNGTGLHGLANTGIDGYGVYGESYNGFGVVGSGGRYGMYGYSSNGFAIFGQSSGNLFFPQLVLFQENGADSCRLRMGSAAWPQWNIAVTSGATPRMEFFNGTTNVVLMDYLGNVSAKTFTPSSDKNAKENFQGLNPREVLDRVTQLPIQTWNFKDDPKVRHMGPMAQDFYAAFEVGPDEKHIATVDADGVALAAIQGLNQVVKDKDERIAALEKRLADLEKLVSTLATKR